MSTLVCEVATDIKIMDIISGDWMTVGPLHFMVYEEKVTSFLWAKLYNHMTTSNSLSMLSKIMQVHG